jgi:hypothetical protein
MSWRRVNFSGKEIGSDSGGALLSERKGPHCVTRSKTQTASSLIIQMSHYLR